MERKTDLLQVTVEEVEKIICYKTRNRLRKIDLLKCEEAAQCTGGKYSARGEQQGTNPAMLKSHINDPCQQPGNDQREGCGKPQADHRAGRLQPVRAQQGYNAHVDAYVSFPGITRGDCCSIVLLRRNHAFFLSRCPYPFSQNPSIRTPNKLIH